MKIFYALSLALSSIVISAPEAEAQCFLRNNVRNRRVVAFNNRHRGFNNVRVVALNNHGFGVNRVVALNNGFHHNNFAIAAVNNHGFGVNQVCHNGFCNVSHVGFPVVQQVVVPQSTAFFAGGNRVAFANKQVLLLNNNHRRNVTFIDTAPVVAVGRRKVFVSTY